MKDKWIHPDTKLPPPQVPVLCIVKALCDCEHYIPSVMAREIIAHDGDWRWYQGENIPLAPRDYVKMWQPLPEMPKRFVPAWEE